MSKTTTRSLQDYLSFGYLFLLSLGIIKDSIYYSFLGINILSYSNVLDVLLSPVIYLTRHIMLPLFIIGTILLAYVTVHLNPFLYKRFRDKRWYIKYTKRPIAELDERYAKPIPPERFLWMAASFIFVFYIGLGVGGGATMKEKLQSKTIPLDHTIVFVDKTAVKVTLIGHNNQYLFYAQKGDQHVTVVPVQGNVRSIVQLSQE